MINKGFVSVQSIYSSKELQINDLKELVGNTKLNR